MSILELVEKFVVGVGGGWVVGCEFSVLLWSKPFPFRLLSFGLGPSRTKTINLVVHRTKLRLPLLS